MQSVKNIIIFAVLMVGSGLVQAAPTTDLPPAPKNQTGKPALVGNGEKAASPEVKNVNEKALNEQSAELTMQDHIQALVEQDYLYQSEYRKLQQQVELEKMLSEIRKLRGEDKIKARATPTPVIEAKIKTEKSAPAVNTGNNIAKPHVVLESVIGGLSRVAIANQRGDTLLYVTPGNVFSMDGAQYILTKDRKNGLQIKEANP